MKWGMLYSHHPAHHAVCIYTLAQFTQPKKGYLWQLIMLHFMHINESCAQPFPVLQRKSNSSLNGKLVTGRIQES